MRTLDKDEILNIIDYRYYICNYRLACFSIDTHVDGLHDPAWSQLLVVNNFNHALAFTTPRLCAH